MYTHTYIYTYIYIVFPTVKVLSYFISHMSDKSLFPCKGGGVTNVSQYNLTLLQPSC